jgi:hypothetical protein
LTSKFISTRIPTKRRTADDSTTNSATTNPAPVDNKNIDAMDVLLGLASYNK